MSLIDGIGDEVLHFFIALSVIIIISLAWWTTNIRDHWHIRTVYLLDRRFRRFRNRRRLTNHTEVATISESTMTSNENNQIEEIPQSIEESAISSEHEANGNSGIAEQEQSAIVQTMDAETCILRQRRLSFYENRSFVADNNERVHVQADHNSEPAQKTKCAKVEVKTAESGQSNNETNSESQDEPKIRIKLKYINDDLKLVEGRLEELLGDFKRRNFDEEISTNKLVRLIFNGQVLERDADTLQSCGMFDNCVVHCLVHQRRPNQSEERGGGRSDNSNSHNNIGRSPLNNNNNNRDWDLGNLLIALLSSILGSAWYFRYQFPHLFTITATVALVAITGIFTVVSVGMYFPDPDPVQPRQEVQS